MTTTIPHTSPTRHSTGILACLPPATWSCHILVTTLALFSLASGRFNLWLDLRLLDPFALPVEILWAATALLIPLLAGPSSRINTRPRSPRALIWARRLLWPSYFLLAALLANTLYFFHLFTRAQADREFPLPLLAAILLATWVLLTREWIRRSLQTAPSPPPPPSKKIQRIATLLTLPAVLLLAASFLVHMYAYPPQDPIDLAVVLGGRLRADASASVELTDRTRVAIDLYKRGLVHRILLSGGIYPPAKTGAPEANEVAAMKKVCLDNGIPENAISLDPVGINTRATALNTAQFMRDRRFSTVVACSTDYHLFRTALAFHEVGLDAYTLPARPTAWQCANPYDTLREIAAIATYILDPHYRQPKALTMHLEKPRLLVRKSANTVELFDGPTPVKTYPCITGGNPGDKAVEGDRKTPLGSFRIVYKNPESKFHLSLGLDYPNKEDADRGLAAGLITRQQYNGILSALTSDLSREENQKKLWYTPLGGEIFLHGRAEGRENTAGCIALSNPDIEELYAILPINTPVEIQP